MSRQAVFVVIKTSENPDVVPLTITTVATIIIELLVDARVSIYIIAWSDNVVKFKSSTPLPLPLPPHNDDDDSGADVLLLLL